MKWKVVMLIVALCMFLMVPAVAVEFTDANGRLVSIENPRRVVSLYSSYGDAWMQAGGTLVGTIEDTFGDSAKLAESGVQILGNHMNPNMELLFSLEPDFVLLAANVASHVEIGQMLEAAKIPCAYFNTPDWRSYMQNIELFSRMTGREDLYQEQVEAVQRPIEAIVAEVQQNDVHFGKTTALFLRANSTSVKAMNNEGSVTGCILDELGFVNIADGDSPLSENLSMESILMEDPDFIFLVIRGSDTEAAMDSMRTALTENPAWNTLTAVREGRFIILDRELFHYHPNARWAESYAMIAELIEGVSD